MIPKPPLPAGAAEPPNVKGDGAVLPNTELLVPLLVVWVVAPKPEVVAAPKEKTAVVLPKAGWVLAGVPKAEAVDFKPPKADCAVLPKAGWVGVGAGVAVGAGAAEFPKVKELPKLGTRIGLVAPCCCPSVAPKGWGLAPEYDGTGALVLEPKGMLNVGVVVLLNVRVGWLVVTGAEVVRVLPKPLKPAVLLLLVAVCTAVGRDWPKVVVVVVVVVVEVGMAVSLPNWNMGPMVGLKLAPEEEEFPKRKGWEVEVVVLVMPFMVLVTLLTPKPKAGFEAESAEVLGVVTEATVEVALAWPVKRGAPVVVAGVVF